MESVASCTDTLKTILRNVRNPNLLDEHPWACSLIVQERLADDPRTRLLRPGQQLIHAIAGVFCEMQPATPPRRGKRLDPRWGEFGLLAALYFTPFRQGTSFPNSLLDAWRRIDAAILYHVYGKPAAMLTPDQIQKYQLVGAEVEYGSASTLSDWHKKGVQRLAGILVNREQYLSHARSQTARIVDSTEPPSVPMQTSQPRKRQPGAIVLLVLCVLLILGGLTARNLYISSRKVLADVNDFQQLRSASLTMGDLAPAYSRLLELKGDLAHLNREVHPFLWLSPRLGWLPVYGGDISSAPEFLQISDHLVQAADLSYQATKPLMDRLTTPASTLDPPIFSMLLVRAQPQLQAARLELDQALRARDRIDLEELSPRMQKLLRDDLDPLLKQADQGLSLATALPGLLGAGSGGPRTYLLLVENEDELRPTGGFITSVGNVVIDQGNVISLKFEDMGIQEDWSKPYPAAPWQLQEYMNSRVLILRDANWFVDFPTSAHWAEYLYAYTHAHSVDGVIAFDQHFLVTLLHEIGPLNVEGAPYPLTDQNVVQYMRQAKNRPAEEANNPDWQPKAFIGQIGEAVLLNLMNGSDHDWRAIAQVFSRGLSERHLLVQFDDPLVTAFLREHSWDNAVRSDGGDFLMVTDTNIGFNKTNAVVETSLSYDVDLRNVASPESTLMVAQKNNATSVPCGPYDSGQITDEKYYPIDRCYWNYLRVYKPAGTALLDATPHAIPGDWMVLGKDVPARVDDLQEQLPGLQGFGTLVVVPAGQSLQTSFRFSLPAASVLTGTDSHELIYRLHVQKQPGTVALPLVIRIHLPEHAIVNIIPADGTWQADALVFQKDLRTDLDLELVFHIP